MNMKVVIPVAMVVKKHDRLQCAGGLSGGVSTLKSRRRVQGDR
jgi:hypothetical protein